MDSLPLFHRIAGQPVIVLGEGEAAEAKRRLVLRAGGTAALEDDPAARLAFVAMEHPDEAAARLRARGVLVNVPDRPDLCDFTVPSMLDRSPVLIAIGTGGASAGLAKALRLRLETILPPALGALASGLAAACSAMRSRWSDAGERRRALDAALADGGILDPLDEASGERVSDWLNGDALAIEPGVAEIILRSGDPDDLTLREARLLGAADTIAFEHGVPPAILARVRADARQIAVEIGEVPAAMAGLTVVLRAP